MDRVISWQKNVSPLTAGLIIGFAAVFVGAFTGLAAVEHYGFCTTCHGRDLVTGLVGYTSGLVFPPLVWPVLTTVGVVLGAWLARRVNGERTPRQMPFDLRHDGGRVGHGFVVMSLALLALGCPIRMIIRAADLNLQGSIGLIGVAIGISAGVGWLRRQA